MSTIETDAAQVLRSAAEHIEKVGLFQGTWFAPASVSQDPIGDRPCCVLGAVGYEAGYWFPDPHNDMDYDSVSLYSSADNFRITAAAARAANLNEIGRWALGKSLAIDYPGEVDLDAYEEPHDSIHPPEWNDTEGRTKEEAVAALRKAAERLESGALGEFPRQALHEASA